MIKTIAFAGLAVLLVLGAAQAKYDRHHHWVRKFKVQPSENLKVCVLPKGCYCREYDMFPEGCHCRHDYGEERTIGPIITLPGCQ